MTGAVITVGGEVADAVGRVSYLTRRGMYPASLTFECVNAVFVGDEVTLSSCGTTLFVGRIFSVTRTKGKYTASAYDLLRYFENRDTIELTGRTASEILHIIALSYGFPRGEIRDTEYKLGTKICDMKSLFDIAETALSLTESMGEDKYALFDDCGRISLLPEGELICEDVIFPSECSSFSVKESIDEDFYSEVMLYIDGDGGREYTRVSNEEARALYGTSRYLGQLSRAGAGILTAEGILRDYSSPKVTAECVVPHEILSAKGGYTVMVYIDGVKKSLFCERAEHIYTNLSSSVRLSLSSV
ncbi:MAG: hypothetical protein LUH59_07465 [Firmicutes bacterium]|nr:hypothetical protein [Bacillota bacterium]